jgi:hypothetical protein
MQSRVSMSRQIGDRGLRLSGPESIRVANQPLVESLRLDGDRALVNPARLTRTRFYSARTTPLSIAPHRPGDCEEMNSAAASPAHRSDELHLFRREQLKTRSLAMKKKTKHPP